jgi:hypothetical protein
MLTVEILQLPALRSYPATELCQFPSACLGFSLYSLGAERTENTAHNSVSIIVLSSCLAVTQILLTILPSVTKQRLFLLAIVKYQRYCALKYVLNLKVCTLNLPWEFHGVIVAGTRLVIIIYEEVRTQLI